MAVLEQGKGLESFVAKEQQKNHVLLVTNNLTGQEEAQLKNFMESPSLSHLAKPGIQWSLAHFVSSTPGNYFASLTNHDYMEAMDALKLWGDHFDVSTRRRIVIRGPKLSDLPRELFRFLTLWNEKNKSNSIQFILANEGVMKNLHESSWYQKLFQKNKNNNSIIDSFADGMSQLCLRL